MRLFFGDDQRELNVPGPPEIRVWITRPYEGKAMVNKAFVRPYSFLGGYVRGCRLTSHKKNQESCGGQP